MGMTTEPWRRGEVKQLEADIRIVVKGGDVHMHADGLTTPGIYRLLEMLVERYKGGEYLDMTDVVGEN